MSSLAWAVALIAIASTIRLFEGSWLAPGAYFSLVWVVAAVPATFIPGLIASDYVFLLVCSFIVFAAVGSAFGRTTASAKGFIRSAHPDAMGPRPGGSLPLTSFVCALSLGGWYAAYSYLSAAGMTASNFNDSSTWIRIAAEYSAARYEGQETETLFVRILLALNYCSALLAGLCARLNEKAVIRILSLSPVLAAALLTIITTAKAPAILCVIFYVSGHLACEVWRGPSRQGFIARFFVGMLVLGAVSILVIGSLVLRYGEEGLSSADLVLERGGSYVFGHMAALSAWLSFEGVGGDRLSWGQLTFAGVFELLNLGERLPGLYGEIGLNEFSTESNVYSAFRGLVVDFSLPGAWVATFCVMSVVGHSYERVRRRQCGALSLGLLIVYYSASAWSPIVSLFIYNSIILAVAIALILLQLLCDRIIADLRKFDVEQADRAVESC